MTVLYIDCSILSAVRSMEVVFPNKAYDLVMSMFGGMSKAERTRVKVVVRTSWPRRHRGRAIIRVAGHHCGYTLKDLGAPQHAESRRRQAAPRSGTRPATAPVVARLPRLPQWQRHLRIAEAITSEGILSPSTYDRQRNPHRDGRAWAKSAVRISLPP